MNLIPAWARRRPWHNWVYAGFYLTTFGQGVAGILTPPHSILDQAGVPLAILWSITTAVAGVIGFVGAVGPTVSLPIVRVWHGRLRFGFARIVAPNFRLEMTAAVIGWLGVFLYASSIWLTLIFQSSPDRASAAWGVMSHFWPLLFRWVYFHLRERAEVDKREQIARIVAQPAQGGASEPQRP